MHIRASKTDTLFAIQTQITIKYKTPCLAVVYLMISLCNSITKFIECFVENPIFIQPTVYSLLVLEVQSYLRAIQQFQNMYTMKINDVFAACTRNNFCKQYTNKQIRRGKLGYFWTLQVIQFLPINVINHIECNIN